MRQSKYEEAIIVLEKCAEINFNNVIGTFFLIIVGKIMLADACCLANQ